MNRSLLPTLPIFLLFFLGLTMTPSVTPTETSAKPPIDPSLYVPIIQDIRESKRTVLLMASLPTRLLIIVSAPASTTLTDALVFEQSRETLQYNERYSRDTLTMRLETAPKLFTEKWPAMAHLSEAATSVAVYDTERDLSLTERNQIEYLLIGDTGTLYLLHLNTGTVTIQRPLNASSFAGLFSGAILLSSGKPLSYVRLLSRGSTHTLKAEKIFFQSKDDRLATFESTILSEQHDTYICQVVQSYPERCDLPRNWSLTYGFLHRGSFHLNDALNASLIRTVGNIFEPKSHPTLVNFWSGYQTFPLVAFWALPGEEGSRGIDIESQSEATRFSLYLGIALLAVLLGVALVAFKYGCKGKSGKKSTSSKKKNASSRSKQSIRSASKSKRSKTDNSSQSKKGSSSSKSSQA